MRYLLLLLSLLVLISCDSEKSCCDSKKTSKPITENPERRKEIAAWTDSLLNATSEVSLYAGGLATMSIDQKRMPDYYHLEKSVKMHLTRDSIMMDYLTIPLSDFATLDREVTQQLYPELWKEIGISEDVPISIFLGIDKVTPVETVIEVIEALCKSGYTQICFAGLVIDQPQLPSIPDTVYYQEIQDALQHVHREAFMTAYADLAEGEIKKWKPALQIFDSIGNVAGFYPKIAYQAEKYPKALQSYEKSDRILTLLYFLVHPYSFPARKNTAVRSFVIAGDGKELLFNEDALWGDVAPQIFCEGTKRVQIRILR